MIDGLCRLGAMFVVSVLGVSTLRTQPVSPSDVPTPTPVITSEQQEIEPSEQDIRDPYYLATMVDMGFLDSWPTGLQVEPPPMWRGSSARPTAPATRMVWARVTACSPHDPKDIAYYRVHGYKGAMYNIAADYKVFPKGTRIRVPGYMDTSYPGRFWVVDSPGGSKIRQSTAKGIIHIDVKFKTYYSAVQWGSRWMYIEVQE